MVALSHSLLLSLICVFNRTCLVVLRASGMELPRWRGQVANAGLPVGFFDFFCARLRFRAQSRPGLLGCNDFSYRTTEFGRTVSICADGETRGRDIPSGNRVNQ